MRLSDILKKKAGEPNKGEPPKEEAPKKEEPQVIQPISIIQVSKAMAQKEEQAHESLEKKPPEMQIVKAMKEIEVSKEDFTNFYNIGIQLNKDVLADVRESRPVNLSSIKDWVGKIVDYLVVGDKELLSHFYEQSNDCYLYSHMVNVSITSIQLGLSMGYNKSRLCELGLASFLYDIGMVKVEEIALQSRVLSKEEHKQIEDHTGYGVAILSQIKDIPATVVSASKEHHERMTGKGYPLGAKGGAITEYARIIALVDVYEALTHKRAYRQEYSAHEAIKIILTEMCSVFDPAVLRILVNQVGIYPMGSWVELNTKEVGKVITTNVEFPLRPVIKLLFDSAGNRLTEPKVINLGKQPNLYIKRPLCDKDISCHISKECQ